MHTYPMTVAGVKRELPICKVTDDLYIGAFICFGDAHSWGNTQKEVHCSPVPGCGNTPLCVSVICAENRESAGCLSTGAFLYVAYYSLHFTKSQ